jgi:hypothetical protein
MAIVVVERKEERDIQQVFKVKDTKQNFPIHLIHIESEKKQCHIK